MVLPALQVPLLSFVSPLLLIPAIAAACLFWSRRVEHQRQLLLTSAACAAVAAEPRRTIKRAAVLVNPHAGSGNGLSVYEGVVEPMLIAAQVEFELHYTAGAGHARQICADLAKRMLTEAPFDVVISVSGDGMLHECLNGLLDGSADRSCPCSLAIVPAGSGNGVATSLYGRGHDAVHAMRRILLAPARPIDVLALRYLDEPASTPPTCDLHFACWACFADHDFLCEGPLRPLGPLLKMALAPLIVIGRCRGYGGVCDFEPAPLPAALSADAVADYAAADELPPSPDVANMRRLEGPFWCWAVGNLSEGGGDTQPTPHAQPSDGAADLLVVQHKPTLSRWRVLQLFLAMESGNHVKDAAVRCYKVRRVRLNSGGNGHLQLSGQEIPNKSATEIEVLRGVASMRY